MCGAVRVFCPPESSMKEACPCLCSVTCAHAKIIILRGTGWYGTCTS